VEKTQVPITEMSKL